MVAALITALVVVVETALVVAVEVALDLVLGHVPIIAKLHVQDIVKKHVQLDALLAMVALIAVGAMAHVQSDVTLLVMQVPMHKL